MATTQTTKMFAPSGIGGLIQAPSGTYVVASDGTVSANAADAQFLLGLGFEFAVTDHKQYTWPGAPAASSGTVTVSSTSLTAGSLTIAAQPDVPRQLQAIIFPGSAAITAGSLTLVYTANDGTTQTDVLSVIAASQTVGTAGLTVGTSKGVERLASVNVSAIVGGVTPGVQIGTNNFLAVPVPPRFVDFVVVSENKITFEASGLGTPAAEAVPTLQIAAGALVTPTTTPNTTLGFSCGYNVTFPG